MGPVRGAAGPGGVSSRGRADAPPTRAGQRAHDFRAHAVRERDVRRVGGRAVELCDEAGLREGQLAEALAGLAKALAGFEGAKGPMPALEGLWGKPTVVNNVMTLAAVPRRAPSTQHVRCVFLGDESSLFGKASSQLANFLPGKSRIPAGGTV